MVAELNGRELLRLQTSKSSSASKSSIFQIRAPDFKLDHYRKLLKLLRVLRPRRAVQKVQDTLDACELVSAHSMGTSPRVGGAEQMNHLADASFSTSTLLGFFNLVLLIVPFAIALILNCAPTLCQKLISFSVRRLPHVYQVRMYEEWRAGLAETSGTFAKLTYALGLIRASAAIESKVPLDASKKTESEQERLNREYDDRQRTDPTNMNRWYEAGLLAGLQGDPKKKIFVSYSWDKILKRLEEREDEIVADLAATTTTSSRVSYRVTHGDINVKNVIFQFKDPKWKGSLLGKFEFWSKYKQQSSLFDSETNTDDEPPKKD